MEFQIQFDAGDGEYEDFGSATTAQILDEDHDWWERWHDLTWDADSSAVRFLAEGVEAVIGEDDAITVRRLAGEDSAERRFAAPPKASPDRQRKTLKEALDYAAGLAAKPSYNRTEEKKPMTKVETETAAEPPREATLTGRIAVMPSGKGERRSISVDRPYLEIRELVRATAYTWDDASGFQRPIDPDHVNALAKAMREGRYTPAPLVASIKASHAEKLALKGGKASLAVSPDDPLALTDGQHRLAALAKLYEEDPDKWGKATIALLVMLDHEHLASDFLQLQKGKPVNRSLLKSLELTAGLVDPEKRADIELATDAIRQLAKSTKSFLTQGVSYDKEDKRRLQYASLIADNGSSIGTTVLGGARIARKYEKSADWLAKRYIEAYQGLRRLCKPDDADMGEDSVRSVFAAGKLLEPLLSGGTRGGSHLLVGLCNLYAWRLASQGKDKGDEAELKHLADTVDATLDKEFDGGAATAKREHLGAFAVVYCKDLGVPKVEKVPADLIQVLSPSTLEVKIKVWKEHRKKADQPKRGRGRPPGSKNKRKRRPSPVATTA